MLRIHFLAGLLALGLAAGCKAQPASPAAQDPSMNRRIEVLVRANLNVPPDIDLAVGARRPSQFTGYETLPITLSKGDKSTVIDFLISADGKTLARMETYDLLKNPNFSIDVTGRPIRGNPAAKVTVVNFDDLECPYCARMHQTLFPATLNRYKDRVRFIYKDNPLFEIHPWALRAAVDANCLAALNGDAYWAFVDYVHSHGQEVSGQDRDVAKSGATLDRIARQQGMLAKLDLNALQACIVKQDEKQVRVSAAEAEALGASGAPALFVNGERIDGAVPESELWAVIDRALRDEGVAPPPPETPGPQATIK